MIPLVGVAGAREQPHALASVLATEQPSPTPSAASSTAPTPPSPLLRRSTQAITSAEKTHRRRPVRRAAAGGREYLRLRAGRRADRGCGRRRQDHPACGGGRRLRGGRLPGGRHRHLRAGGPHPGQRGGGGRVPDVGQPAVAPRPRPARPRRAQRGHPRRGRHDRRRPPGRPHRPHRGRRGQAGARRRPPPAGGGRPGRGARRPSPPPPRRRPPADARTAASTTRRNVAPWRELRGRRRRQGGRLVRRARAASTLRADRDDALQQAVDAWAADVAAGHQTGLYAWRRANVAALNQRARAWMDATGRLSGPELVCPGGHAYRAGDRVVTLAPAADGRLVTSQRAVIAAVDLSGETLTLRTDDGQHVHLRMEEAGADRLGYGYATTVHRVPRIDHRAGPPLRRRRRPGTGLCGHVPGPPVHPRVDRRRRPAPKPSTTCAGTGPPGAPPPGPSTPALPDPSHPHPGALPSAPLRPAGPLRRPPARRDGHRRRRHRGHLPAGSGRHLGPSRSRSGASPASPGRSGHRQRCLAGHRGGSGRQGPRPGPPSTPTGRAGRRSGARWRDRHAARKETAVWAQREVDAQQRWETHVAPIDQPSRPGDRPPPSQPRPGRQPFRASAGRQPSGHRPRARTATARQEPRPTRRRRARPPRRPSLRRRDTPRCHESRAIQSLCASIRAPTASTTLAGYRDLSARHLCVSELIPGVSTN